MRHLELNLEKIKLIAKEREEENYNFRLFLKGCCSDEVDKIVHQLNNEIISQIDCRECGNCCVALRPCVNDEDINYLSQLEKVSAKVFCQQFVVKDDFENVQYLKNMPCRYLKDKQCSIYERRPLDCRSYPHTQKTGFTSRTHSIIENYEICPIVFNLYELLKSKTHFKK
jgi:Fe-S-cluster containining protein